MSEIRKYLEDYKDGNIKMGLEIGVNDLDEVLRYKQGQFNLINGLDNVGKTAWILWYFLCLSYKHNLTWCIWSGENKSGMLVRQLIEFYSGTKLKNLSIGQIYKYELQIAAWFTFIPNDKMYTNKELYKFFKESECNGALIDPYTGMKRDYNHAANYDFLNETREFCNVNNITVYVNTHPNTEAARRVYPQDDPLGIGGYPMPPSKSQSEGGQPFANRVDDFITIHRIVGHRLYNFNTLIYTRKIKDTETGGKVVPIDSPISFEYNNGLGFTLGGLSPLKGATKKEKQTVIQMNTSFSKTSDLPF